MEKLTVKQRVDAFCKFLWNSEKKEFLGRDGRSWAEIGLFYLVFYTVLAAFFAATIAGFYQTIEDAHPKLQGTDSLLKANPGMGYAPMPDIETTLIHVTTEGRGKYVEHINKILKEYNKTNLDNTDCSLINVTRPDEPISCEVNYKKLTENCNEDNGYGFLDGKPCILLKLNRIFGWTPQVWKAADVQGARAVPESIRRQYSDDRIWIDCHGENPADNDNLGPEPLEYSPMQGFPMSFYPFKNQKDYRSPLVFVKFNNLTKHLGLMIECKALAKNIEVDRSEKEGSVHFELLLDV